MALEVVSAGRLDRRRMYYPRVLTLATRPDGTARADQQRIRSQLDLFWRRLLSVVFALAHLICFFFIPPFAKAETWYTPMCPLALTSVQNCVSKRRIASVLQRWLTKTQVSKPIQNGYLISLLFLRNTRISKLSTSSGKKLLLTNRIQLLRTVEKNR